MIRAWNTEIEKAIKGNNRIEPKECFVRCKNGDIRSIMIGARIIEDRMIVSLYDVSDLKNAQDEMMRNLHRFEALFEFIPFPCVIKDSSGRFMMANQYFCRTFGLTADEVMNHTEEELGLIVESADSSRMSGDPLDTEVGLRIEISVVYNGEKRDFIISARTIDWKDEKAMLVAMMDITDRKSAEEALRNSEERYRITAEQTGQMLYDYDSVSGLVKWVGAVGMITGFDHDEFGTTDIQTWFDMIHPDDREMVGKLFSISMENFTPFYSVYRLRRKTGEYIFIEEHGVVLPVAEGKPYRMLGTLIDVTERLRVEKELRRKEEDLRVTLGSIGDAVIATDIEGRIVMMNSVAEKKTGWKIDEASGRELSDIFRTFDGAGGGEVENPAHMVFASKDIVHIHEYTTLIARDGSQCLISDSAAPIHNDSGDIIGVVIVFRDVTEEKSIRDRLRQSEKMDAVGQLAGGIAHDFNNMLCGILGAAEVLKTMNVADDPETKELLDVIIESSNKAADLTNKLLSFSRQKPDSSERIDALKPLKDAVALIERTMDKRIQVKVRSVAGDLVVMGNDTQLQNAFLNLLINATHAMPEGGEIRVTVSVNYLDKYYCDSSAFRIVPGNYADIEIMDTGSGIAPENLPRIFEPFFTTKGEGRGTGLGLSSVYGTVKQHAGAITVYSEVGKGTVFHIYIPLAENTEQEAAHDT
ncbi:MAG TPA: PAS domain S-box protein, partial [Spirochaetota bacterium]|nr:PAS domain S-box protein [Spirochaetota bacterium]